LKFQRQPDLISKDGLTSYQKMASLDIKSPAWLEIKKPGMA